MNIFSQFNLRLSGDGIYFAIEENWTVFVNNLKFDNFPNCNVTLFVKGWSFFVFRSCFNYDSNINIILINIRYLRNELSGQFWYTNLYIRIHIVTDNYFWNFTLYSTAIWPLSYFRSIFNVSVAGPLILIIFNPRVLSASRHLMMLAPSNAWRLGICTTPRELHDTSGVHDAARGW